MRRHLLDRKARVIAALALPLLIGVLFASGMALRSQRASSLLSQCLPASEKSERLKQIEDLHAHLDSAVISRSSGQEKRDSLRGRLAKLDDEKVAVEGLLNQASEETQNLRKFKELSVQATCKGNYSKLLRFEHSPEKKKELGQFKDVGKRFLRSGYWVYAYPYWFVWERSASVEKQRAADEERDRRAEEKQRQLDARFGSGRDATLFAEKCVKRQVTFPSTAKFGFWPPDAQLDERTGGWRVEGNVKAKNAFNLELRFRYRVLCRKRPDGVWEEIRTQMWEDDS